MKLCVEYATRPSRSRLPPPPPRRAKDDGRGPVGARVESQVARGPPAPEGEATDHDMDSCIDQPPNCQRGRGSATVARRGPALAPGQGARPSARGGDGPAPRPGGEGGEDRPPARLRRRAGAVIRSIVGPRPRVPGRREAGRRPRSRGQP